MNYEIKTLALSDITADEDLQPRIKRNKGLSKQFTDLTMCGEDKFPPLCVFQDGETYYLADGFHRFFAYDYAHRKNVECHVYKGSKRDAILYSVGANGTHGLNMTNADKRRAVTKLLEDPEWSQWSNNKIARTCHVAPTFVSNLRKSLSTVDSEHSQERTYTNKHGDVAVMNTANIGKRATEEVETVNPRIPLNSVCSQNCTSTIAELNKRLAALIQELEFKDELIADLEKQLAKIRQDESLPF